MGRRTLLLITSILIAAVGTALIGLYVRGANDRAIGDNTVQKVLVAKRSIAAGQALGGDDYELADRRAADLPSDFLSQSTQVTGRAVGPILLGQVLEKQMLSAAGGATSSRGIEDGDVGITLELQDPERAAGLLEIGSKIDVYSIINNKVSNPAVLSDVKVIAIGPGNISDSDDSASGDTGTTADAVPTTLVGLTLTDTQVIDVKNAEARGKLFFAVRPSETK